uniref:F-box domain-containing protein n=1 Tax=Tetradesmus obliquus TaxID=3088 RepID=A0A383VN61_TETOB|eukprot:jgi/Sobl393_1/15416/SZX65836.1
MAQHASLPPLLRAAEQLGDAWWAQHILPLLLDQESAAAVTLCCKQLRRLCQSGQQALWLDASALLDAAAVARLPAHFPACKELTVAPCSSDDLAFHLPDALDALTGWDDQLSTLTVDVLDARTADPRAMVMALQGMQRLLAAVQLAQAAASAPAAAAVACEGGVLQRQQDQVVDYGALSSLSSLTALGLPLAAERQGLSSISMCTQLQRLSLEFKGAAGAAQQVTLQPDELSAMGQLTQLTALKLVGTACQDRAGWGFLSRLRQLKELHVTPCLPYAAVAALAHLKCLGKLTCGWEQLPEGQPWPTARCAAVRALCVTDGVPPLHAFPRLTSLVQCMPWDPSVLSGAALCCKQLKMLQMNCESAGTVMYESGSLLVSAPAASRTAAVGRLAALQHLRKVVLSVNDDAEAAAVSSLWQVERLVVVVPLRSSCSMQGLAVLAAMRQLQALTFDLPNCNSRSLQDADLQLLLRAVRHVRRVRIRVQEEHVEGVRIVVRRVERVLTEQGLQLPAKVFVAAIAQD